MSKSSFEFLQPKNWLAPKGYSNGVAVEGRQVFIAGLIGGCERGELVSDDFVAQVERALQKSWRCWLRQAVSLAISRD